MSSDVTQIVESSVRCASSQQQNQLAVLYEGCRSVVKIQHISSTFITLSHCSAARGNPVPATGQRELP